MTLGVRWLEPRKACGACDTEPVAGDLRLWHGGAVAAGGLLAYAPNAAQQWNRAAMFVDKILKGVKPADLPVEQPTTFELGVNIKAARAIGLTIPPSILLRADRVIE